MKAALRAITIATRFGAYATWLAARRLGLRSGGSPARRFAALLEGLGTPFVKLGQHLSLRADLMPAEFIEALQELQDHVSPIESGEAAAEIERALGKPPGAVFARFDTRPFAAASIAQVHGAQLGDGRQVVVKVRRPGIAARVEMDMGLLLRLVRLASAISPTLARHRAPDVVRQVWHNLRRELDLREEARNVRRFADAFSGSPTIMVPDVVETLCTESVMVQLRSGGARVDQLSDRSQGRALARNFVDAYVHQFFTMGLFHGDPHPGNLFVTADGRICFHDFGIVGTLDRPTRQALAAFTLGFADQDSDWIVDSWLELGMLDAATDREALRPVIADIVADCSRRPLREWSMGAAFMQLVNSSRGHTVAVPLNLLVLARTLLLMESTVRMLDPEFSLMDALASRARDVLKVALAGEEAGGMRLQFESAVAATEWRRLLALAVRHVRQRGLKLQVEHEGLPGFADTQLKAANRVSVALVTLGLYLAASLLMQHSLGPVMGGLPVLAVLGYAAAIWYTTRLVRAVGAGL